MSAFNHMGKHAKVEGEWVFYDYYPDYFSHAETFGTFKIKSSSLAANEEIEYAFTNRLGCREHGLSRPDEQVVLALMRKIKASVAGGGALPEMVYHNA
jgi:hypothetical protein